MNIRWRFVEGWVTAVPVPIHVMWTGESLVATVNQKVLYVYKCADMNALHPLSRHILLALNKKADKHFQFNNRICELNIVSTSSPSQLTKHLACRRLLRYQVIPSRNSKKKYPKNEHYPILLSVIHRKNGSLPKKQRKSSNFWILMMKFQWSRRSQTTIPQFHLNHITSQLSKSSSF